MQEEQPLQVFFLSFFYNTHIFWLLITVQVARCTKIISPNTEDAKYVINVKQIAKVQPIICTSLPVFGYNWFSSWLQFVVGLGDKVSPTDIEEGMRVGCVPCLSTHFFSGLFLPSFLYPLLWFLTYKKNIPCLILYLQSW